ncbi:MAG: flavodoxin [Lachnospiraceae bacterium]|nr:flavodoxin [Lachnospiraceae bacterium]
MKKIISLLTVFTLLFCLAACSSNNTTEGDNPSSSGDVQSSVDNRQNQPDDSQNPPSSSEKSSDPADEPTETGSKALVVYFSHSGNTESVAKEIQSQTGADIFEIVPATPYTTDYNTLLDVAQNEKRDNARPAISGTVENLDDYDTVYLGYPNWWADMPMVLYTFLDTYDLSGKTIAPFVTSGGSGFSNTISTIKSMEPNATVTDGLSIRDSAAGNPASAVSDWLEKLK